MKRKGFVITILSGLMLLVAACSDPAADQTKARTGEAAQVASPQPRAGSEICNHAPKFED